MNFFATAVLLFLAGMVVYLFSTDDFVPPADRKSVWRSLIPDFSPLAGSGSLALWTLLAIVAATQIAGSILSPFLPLFIKSISASTERIGSDTGLVLALGAGAASISAVLIGKVSFRFGYRRTLMFCMGGAALFTFPQAFVRTTGQLMVLRILSNFFIGGNMSSVNALISLKTPTDKHGSIYGLRGSIGSIGQGLGPVIGTIVALNLGYRAVFIATACVLAVSGIAVPFFVSLREERPKEA